MSSEARVVAQAKLNLFLRVLAREESGYHQIETMFCRLVLGDDIVVRTGVRGRTLDCAGERLPGDGLGPPERNLGWRAAVAYAEEAGWPQGFAIEIDKRIPVGGGLGGGSADAGAVLRCLNALAPAPIAPHRLLAIAASLGADVPFLTSETPCALAWGRGERMLALSPLPPAPVYLMAFRDGVSTGDAYGWLADARRGAAVAAPGPLLVEPSDVGTWDGVARLAANDFEEVVRPRHALVNEVLSFLRGPGAREFLGARHIALMSGSGATVFAVPHLELVGSTESGTRDHSYCVSHTSDEVEWIETSSAASVVPVAQGE